MKLITIGSSRWVLLIGNYAIKFPNPSTKRSWLNGLLANMQELSFAQTKTETLCPVIYCAWFGFLLIMPRCAPITRERYFKEVYDKYELDPSVHNGVLINCGTYKLGVERKMDSFGVLDNRVVALDYGN